MMKHGSMQVRLGSGWACGGSPSRAFRISVILNCQLDEVPFGQAELINRIL